MWYHNALGFLLRIKVLEPSLLWLLELFGADVDVVVVVVVVGPPRLVLE